MFPIVVMIIVVIILYIWNFPGGPSGFAVCTSSWLKRKKDALLSALFRDRIITPQSYDTQRAYEPFHPQ